MLRMAIAIALIALSTPAFAQMINQVKDIKFGVGCLAPVNTVAARLGTCAIDGSKARIWCPSGEIFERNGEPPQSYVARSICNVSQVL